MQGNRELNFWSIREIVLTRNWGDYNNGQRSGLVLSASFPIILPNTYNWMVDCEVIRSVWGSHKGLFTLCELKKMMEHGGFGIVEDAREYTCRSELWQIIGRWLEEHPEMTEAEHERKSLIMRFAENYVGNSNNIREAVRNIMVLLDEKKDHMEEGVYITLCGAIMKAWNTI